MDEVIAEYRRKHPRCRYCEYHVLDRLSSSMSLPYTTSLHKCIAKDKYLYDCGWDFKGFMCGLFRSNDEV